MEKQFGKPLTLKGLENGDLGDTRYSIGKLALSEAGQLHETLTQKQVSEIRELYATGKYSQYKLAKMYGFKGGNPISEIILNNTYYNIAYTPPANSVKFKEQNKVMAILDKLPSEFTSTEIANVIIELGFRTEFRLAKKWTFNLLRNPEYFKKLPLIGVGNQYNIPKYTKA